jgi:hypothetical protein
MFWTLEILFKTGFTAFHFMTKGDVHLMNKVQKCWCRRMNTRWHTCDRGLLVGGAQLKRQKLHNPSSPTNLTQIFFTDTAPELPIYCNNYIGFTNCKSIHYTR